MTTFAAYDAGMPCKNPSCKSHGQPHPNCRCYPNLAKGGEVGAFCDQARMHDKSCEYYAEGGEVSSIPQHNDPELSVASYLAGNGLYGLLKLGSNNEDKFENRVDRYNKAIKRGQKRFENKIQSLFDGSAVEKIDHSKAKELINEWVENGGVTKDIQDEIHNQNQPQAFAEGGEVKKNKHGLYDHHLAEAYPEQNIMLQAAKGRMSEYLKSLKPQKEHPQFLFDEVLDNKKQQKSYDRALKIAADPSRVVDKIKHGLIEPEHVQHFQNLYPEINDALHKHITEKLLENHLKGVKPDYKVRQSLSLFMGTPLGSDLTPGSIQSAQATFAAKKANQQQPQKKTSALDKADDRMLTSNQARTERSQKS